MKSRVRLGVAVAVAIAVLAMSASSPAGSLQTQGSGTRYVDTVFAAVDVTGGVVYATPTGWDGTPVTLWADVYEPRGDPAVDRRVVVLVHGGGFAKGTRSDLRGEAIEMARRGYVAVAVDYRLRPDPTMTWCDFVPGGPDCDPRLADAIGDAAADVGAAVDAVRAAHEDMRVDPVEVAVMGWSAGAITALYLAHGTVPGGHGGAAPTPRIQAAVSFMGAMAPDDVASGAAPVLMVHGTDDTVVPYAAAEAATLAAQAAGDDSRLVSFPGVGHGFDPPDAAAAAGQAVAFLDGVLGP